MLLVKLQTLLSYIDFSRPDESLNRCHVCPTAKIPGSAKVTQFGTAVPRPLDPVIPAPPRGAAAARPAVSSRRGRQTGRARHVGDRSTCQALPDPEGRSLRRRRRRAEEPEAPESPAVVRHPGSSLSHCVWPSRQPTGQQVVSATTETTSDLQDSLLQCLSRKRRAYPASPAPRRATGSAARNA
jgi:hypothetical protein